MSSSTVSSFPSGSINFYLKHLNVRTLNKILYQTGWVSFTEYELQCRETDLFKCRITNGLLDNERPSNIDEDRFLITEISLHHLTHEFQNYLIDNYLRMSRIEYELQYSKFNSLYVVVPYYDEDIEYYSYSYNDNHEDTINTMQNQPNSDSQLTIHHYFDYKSDDNEEEIVIKKQTKNKEQKPLHKFKFILNPKTKNSYILHRNMKSRISDNTVIYTDGKEFPSRWSVIPEYRDIIFKSSPPQSIAGWIVGLSKHDELIRLGATEVKK